MCLSNYLHLEKFSSILIIVFSMSQNNSEVLRLSRTSNRESPNSVPVKKERRRSVRGRRSEIVVCPDTTNSPGVVISTQSEENMNEQRSKRKDLLKYKAMLEEEMAGWEEQLDAAQLRRRKEIDTRKENIDRDFAIERCGLYRSFDLEDPAVMYASVLKRVDDYSQMSAEEAVIEKVAREVKCENEEAERNDRLITNFRDVLTSETEDGMKAELEYWQGIIHTETINIETFDSLIRELEYQL
ncbi:hypothetical protein PENTCL1PPCAC_6450 [Pristionchus entomophagus]|uniref:Uncharacterized protein n=1 Tax=Pristionchus entomophagus TaxID=358040 RepID=A0AAV5SMR4_9BILA|nr:hypothetical protein PENTCL1PPCAC_6450 [Pristionchus entomophagus]